MNALVSVRFTLDIPEARIKSIMGRPDDGSDAYHYDATHKVEECRSRGRWRPSRHARLVARRHALLLRVLVEGLERR